jgi:hypothetical protein
MKPTPEQLKQFANGELSPDEMQRLLKQLHALSPTALQQMLVQGGIGIDGNGNIIGHGNVILTGEAAKAFADVQRELLQQVQVSPAPAAPPRPPQTFASFADEAAALWYSHPWVRRLIGLDVALFVAFNPYVKTVWRALPDATQFKSYEPGFWLTLAGVFVAALVVGLRARAAKQEPRLLGERTAIKGLLPFGMKDAAVFARLQRDTELKECYDAITARDFRFGILSGESGTGKSSFLQAGLWPAIKKERECVYVKFTDYDPLLTIRHAILEQVTIPEYKRGETSLVELLKLVSTQANGKTLVLLLDQFEQFFLHQKRKKDREPFIQALNEWYRHQPPLAVKILVGIRNDFADRLIELQKVLGYSLGPQQNFRLEKFRPNQAAQIFQVIAETEKLEYDKSFIEEVTAAELADKEDGLVSPVDIQVLAWIVAGQTHAEDRAFQRTAFQKLGGVEGLLERFLRRALDARETPARREATVKVLLALIDLDRNARAGALTLENLREKLQGALTDVDLQEALEWLTRGDVRLVTPVKLANEQGYEIAHERLIPAIRKVGDSVIQGPGKATQLLDRRANEWIGNQRHKRYLLSLPELLLVRQQKPFIQWEPHRKNKEALLAASWKKMRRYSYAICGTLLLALTGTIGWNTQWAQLRLIQWELAQMASSVKEPGALREMAVSYTYQGDIAKAEQVAQTISDPDDKARALESIAAVAAKRGDYAKAEQVARDITAPGIKASALLFIAAVAAKQGDKTRASLLLEQAEQTAKAINDIIDPEKTISALQSSIAAVAAKRGDYAKAEQVAKDITTLDFKASALLFIAAVTAKQGDKTRASFLLGQAEQVAKAISHPDDKASALQAIAVAAARRGDYAKAEQVVIDFSEPYYKANALRLIAEAAAKQGDKTRASLLLEQAEQTAKAISEPDKKEQVFHFIAEAAAKQGDYAKAEQIAKAISEPLYKVRALRLIAEAAAKQGDKTRASLLLEQAEQTAKENGNPYGRASDLYFIAEAAAKQGDYAKAEQVAKDITALAYKARALYFIAEAAAKQGDKARATLLLSQVEQLAQEIGDSDDKASVLQAIAVAAAEQGDFRTARRVSNLQDSINDKAETLALILKTRVISLNLRLADETEEEEHEE